MEFTITSIKTVLYTMNTYYGIGNEFEFIRIS